MRLSAAALSRRPFGPALSLLAGLALVGCAGGKDAASNDDTGNPDTQPVYDEGCITVDGAGGYAHLADAITVASDGSTIALCAGTWAEPVEVAKAVTITGAGADQTFLQGDGTNPALAITAAGVTVSGLTVQSPYIGITTTGASTTIDGVTFDATGSWGLIATAATDLTVTGSTFSNNVDGGLDVEGGNATIEGNTFEMVTSYAIQLTDAADGIVTSNVIDGVSAEKRNLKDGYGVFVDGSSATLSGNQIADAGSVAVRVSDGELTASEETWTGGPFGLYMDGGDLTLSDATLTGQTSGGIFALGSSASVTDTTVTTDPTVACSLDYRDWGATGGDYSCVGVLVAADVGATLERVSTSGFNNAGIYILPYTTTDSVPTTLTDVAVDDTGRIGMYLSGVDATATNVSVTNLREPQLDTPCTGDGSTYSVEYSASMVVAGDVALTNATFADNQGWGISAAGARLQVSDSTFSNNACSAVLNVQSAVELDNVAISGTSTIGLVWDYQGATSITHSSFSGNHATASYSYDYGDGHVYGYEYGPAGVDIQATYSTGLMVDSTTFSGGDDAITSYSSEVDIRNNQFSGYDGTILSAQSNGSTSFSGNSADDFGGGLVSVYYGEVEMSDNTVGTTRTYTGYYASYTDGVLDYESEYDTYGTLVYAYGSTDTPCNLLVDGLTAESVYASALYTYDCAAEFDDVSFGTVGAGASAQALNAYWQSTDPLLIVNGFEAGTVNGTAIDLFGYSTGSSYVDITGVDIGTVTGAGLYAYTLSDLNVTDSDFGDTSSYGVQIIGRSTYDSVATLDNVTVSTGASDGITVSTMADVSITNSVSTGRTTGLRLSDTDATITGNAFTGNSEYGMVCATTVLLDTCSGNDLSGNTLGEHFGCSDACGTE